MSNIEVSYVVNGTKLTLAEMTGSLTDTLLGFALNKYSDHLLRDAAGIACPEHGQMASLEILADESEARGLELNYRVYGCCGRLIETMSAALKS